MHKDARGLTITAASAEAVIAVDRAIDGYVAYAADIPVRMAALTVLDPECPMLHCLKGYFAMLGFKQALVPAARQAAADTWQKVVAGTPREHSHAAALDTWANGHPDRAVEIWNQILSSHPHDILAFRLAHFVNFWLGRPEAMLASVLAVEKHWSEAESGYNAILGCRAFAHEECGYYTEAEAAGREAIRRDPTDLWSAHAVAHVMEMQGRRGEGIAWVEALQANWDGKNNLKHHLWWHQAMYHMERRDFAKVLSLYDTGYRNLESPLTQAQPDLYIDAQNAASMLFRLGRHGVDLGNRWVELADKAEERIGDCVSAFTLPHWMMALAATGREAAAGRMLQGMRDFSRTENNINGKLVGAIALPVTEAVLAHGQGRYARAVAAMRPVLGEMYRLGGSHAQQDVLEQVFMDSAMKAGMKADVQLMIERVSGRHPVPPSRRVGYAHV
jgi:tetratricopeptide (TPR) repeat protein